MATGQGDEPEVAARDRLRAGHADRERVIETLKAAYVQGMLAKDELDARVGQALAARTYADLTALTADIPPGPAVTRPAPRPAPVRRRPLAKAAAGSSGCLVIAAAAVRAIDLADPGPTPGVIPKYWGTLFVLMAVLAVFGALLILGNGVNNSLEQRRSRRQLPPRPGPGGHALDGGQRDGTGHGPVPPGPGDNPDRTDLRAHKPPQRIPARTDRAPRGAGPARGAPVPRAT
jgi:Domain of unknown function (DUF1707)